MDVRKQHDWANAPTDRAFALTLVYPTYRLSSAAFEAACIVRSRHARPVKRRLQRIVDRTYFALVICHRIHGRRTTATISRTGKSTRLRSPPRTVASFPVVFGDVSSSKEQRSVMSSLSSENTRAWSCEASPLKLPRAGSLSHIELPSVHASSSSTLRNSTGSDPVSLQHPVSSNAKFGSFFSARTISSRESGDGPGRRTVTTMLTCDLTNRVYPSRHPGGFGVGAQVARDKPC